MELDVLIASLAIIVGLFGLMMKNPYDYNPKLSDMSPNEVANAIDYFRYELSDIYSLPIIKILNQDLSKDKTVYDGTQVIAYFTPKPNGKSFISIDLEGMKMNGYELDDLCSTIIHEYKHYSDCDQFEDYKNWLKDYERHPLFYELRSQESEKEYTKKLMVGLGKNTVPTVAE